MMPNFTLVATIGKHVQVSDYRGRRNLVLLFCGKGNSQRVLRLLRQISEKYSEFASEETQVLAVVLEAKDQADHLRTLPYPVLWDEESHAHNLAGVPITENDSMPVSRPEMTPAREGLPLAEISSKVENKGVKVGTSPNILTVISDGGIQGTVCRIIHESGLTAICASSLHEAGEILRNKKVSLVICAAYLHDGTFRDLLSVAHEMSTGTVVLCSRSCPSGARIDALELGILDYVSYPLPREELLWVVRSAVAKSGNVETPPAN